MARLVCRLRSQYCGLLDVGRIVGFGYLLFFCITFNPNSILVFNSLIQWASLLFLW